jgi:MFS family permease
MSLASRSIRLVPRAVWWLGATSLLTDLSTDLVSSVLPMYLILHLHLSPFEYGAVDGLYQGGAAAVLGLSAGLLADRTRRHKEIAAAGYATSALCKLAMLGVGNAFVGIAAATGVDRVAKGVRTAPRDALISLHAAPASLTDAFAVHRTLDACGALLGPLLAFALLAYQPGGYATVFAASFAFGLLGVAALWLFVDAPASGDARVAPAAQPSLRRAGDLLARPGFRAVAGAAALLALATVSDGFLYLLLERRGSASAGFFPLLYVGTAAGSMLLAIPIGRLAARRGRRNVLLGGFAARLAVYVLVVSPLPPSAAIASASVALLGLSLAATDGVLMAIASSTIPPDLRASGLALLNTGMGLAKMTASLGFGWLWHAGGATIAVSIFGAGLFAAIATSALLLREVRDGAAI